MFLTYCTKACGEATDLALEKCVEVGAHAVVAPCCVGKLRSDRADPNTFIRTGCSERHNGPLIMYPRSKVFRSILSSYHHKDVGMMQLFNALASAGDYSESQDLNVRDGAIRRTAKTLLEWDRVIWLKSKGYSVKLCKMDPPEASPKNDIIIAYNEHSCNDEADFCGKDVRELEKNGIDCTSHCPFLKMASHYLIKSKS